MPWNTVSSLPRSGLGAWVATRPGDVKEGGKKWEDSSPHMDFFSPEDQGNAVQSRAGQDGKGSWSWLGDLAGCLTGTKPQDWELRLACVRAALFPGRQTAAFHSSPLPRTQARPFHSSRARRCFVGEDAKVAGQEGNRLLAAGFVACVREPASPLHHQPRRAHPDWYLRMRPHAATSRPLLAHQI